MTKYNETFANRPAAGEDTVAAIMWIDPVMLSPRAMSTRPLSASGRWVCPRLP